MSNFVPLEEAAKKLGVSSEEIVEMISRREIFGYRDGTSWKFKPEEIQRVISEMMGDALDEDPAGSSILVSDSDLTSGSHLGSSLGGDESAGGEEGSDVSSDVSLVAEPGAGSDVRLVASGSGISDDDDELRLADSDDDDDELSLAAEDGDDLLAAASDAMSGIGSDLGLDSGIESKGSGATDSDIPLGSDLGLLSEDPSGVISGSDLNLASAGANSSDLIKGDSDPASDASGLGSDLALSDEDDLVLGGGSDLALGTDSGINLMSPSDSGISLEDEPLDLAASGISGLDLAAEDSDVEGGSAAGSAVDFQQDEEFQLSPSGSIEADDDSGSQVIELEDSSEFGDAAVALPAEEGFDAFADVDGGGGLDDAEALGGMAPTGAAAMASPEIPYSLLQVLSLLGILLLMCMSGILITDVVRNMWAWSGGESTLTSGFTDAILSAFGQK